jgi:hypothetical protein
VIFPHQRGRNRPQQPLGSFIFKGQKVSIMNRKKDVFAEQRPTPLPDGSKMAKLPPSSTGGRLGIASASFEPDRNGSGGKSKPEAKTAAGGAPLQDAKEKLTEFLNCGCPDRNVSAHLGVAIGHIQKALDELLRKQFPLGPQYRLPPPTPGPEIWLG